LSEHHGDGSPGARIRVTMQGIEAFHREISSKGYRYMRPGLETTPWGTVETGVIDLFIRIGGPEWTRDLRLGTPCRWTVTIPSLVLRLAQAA
jgi:hypothetical protein